MLSHDSYLLILFQQCHVVLLHASVYFLLSSKPLHFRFLLLLPVLSLYPLSVATSWERGPAQVNSSLLLSPQQRTVPSLSHLSPLPTGRWAPLHSPWCKYTEVMHCVILNTLHNMATKLLKYSGDWGISSYRNSCFGKTATVLHKLVPAKRQLPYVGQIF